MSAWRDLGAGHRYTLIVWSPDRDRNPQYEGIPDIDPLGAIIEHPLGPGPTKDGLRDVYDQTKATGGPCAGAIYFDVPGAERFPGPRWAVESLDPLTVSPSVLCCICGDHGFIRAGRWVLA